MKSKTLAPIKRLVEKFPMAGNLTLAKLLADREPEIFTSIEMARHHVRYWRGASGVANRQSASELLPSIMAPAKRESHVKEPYLLTLPCKALILSDIHIPFQDDAALKAALDEGERVKVNAVVLNGDLTDFKEFSWWDRNPTKDDMVHGIQQTRVFLKLLRKRFPNAQIVWKQGNHEERYEAYLIRKAPELLDADFVSFDHVFFLDDFDIDLVDEKRRIKVGDLNLIHGHEYKGGKILPVNPARSLFLRAKHYAMCGHFHQASYHQGKDIEGGVKSCWSTGCLCDMNPVWQPFNEWMHSFAIVEAEKDGKFEPRTPAIKRGEVYG